MLSTQTDQTTRTIKGIKVTQTQETAWCTYETTEEIYNALIEPYADKIAHSARLAVLKRTGDAERDGFWQEIFQEVNISLLNLMTKRYKQERKPGGVLVIPEKHVNNAIIDAVRLILGRSENGGRTSGVSNTVVKTSNINDPGLAASLTVKQGDLSRLRSKLQDAGVITQDWSNEEVDALTRSNFDKIVVGAGRSQRVSEARRRLLTLGVEAVREILSSAGDTTLRQKPQRGEDRE